MKIESLYRYPVKGLTPEPLAGATLAPGSCIPWDRAFALAQGGSAFDPSAPAWVPKTNFLCLLRNARAALLDARFDDGTGRLTIVAPGGAAIDEDPLTQTGQARLTDFLVRFMGEDARYGKDGQGPKFHYFERHSFCDHRTQVISFIGLGSIGALEQAVGAARDKRRFRANVYVEGLEPWEEFSWLGRKIAIGDTILEVQDRIDRCKATEVNPDTAERDAEPVKELRAAFGHIDLGVFAEVLTGGDIRPGDAIRVI